MAITGLATAKPWAESPGLRHTAALMVAAMVVAIIVPGRTIVIIGTGRRTVIAVIVDGNVPSGRVAS